MLRALTNGTRYAPSGATLGTMRCGAASRSRGSTSEEGGSPDDRSRQELGLVEREPGWKPGWHERLVGPIRVAGRPAFELVQPAGPIGLLVAGQHARRRIHR